MGTGFGKEPSSRPIVYQSVLLSTPGKINVTAKFSPSTQHILVMSQVTGYVSIDQSTSATLVTSTAVPNGFLISASAGTAEYFTVTPGQFLTFCTTGATTGAISVTEMG